MALQRAWRQLLFNAHHDSVTGSQSDQVFLDTLHSYRDALDLAEEVRNRSLFELTRRIQTEEPGGDGGSSTPDERRLVAWNSLGSPRGSWVEVGEGSSRREVYVPAIPAVGYRTYRLPAAEAEPLPIQPESVLENEFLRVTLDLERGGIISSLYDKRMGRELLRGPGNDVVLYQEYPSLPGHGEGPWHLAPTGKRRSSIVRPARLLPRDPTRPDQLVTSARYPLFEKRQTTILRPGATRVDFVTEIRDWRGRNQLLRVEFPLDLPGARPVYETAASVIGRPFAREVDTKDDSWTLDQTCWQWVDLGAVCRLAIVDEDGGVTSSRALGVCEIVLGATASKQRSREAGRLAKALVQCGVTSTTTVETDRRYGDLTYDSNLPDFRVYYGTVDEHALLRAGSVRGTDVQWVESPPELPVLLLRPKDLSGVIDELASTQRIRVRERDLIRRGDGRRIAMLSAPFLDAGVAVVNRGTVSARVTEDGTIGLNLLRSCTSWPSGVWIDPPTRRHPDGSPFGTVHGTHVFHYSLVPHFGDFRDAHLAVIGQDFNQPVHCRLEPKRAGTLPPRMSFFEVGPKDVLLTALKMVDVAEPTWDLRDAEPSGETPGAVLLRLWNGSGRRVTATIKSAYWIEQAHLGNLLEEEVEPLEVSNHESVKIELAPNGFETMILGLVARPRREESTCLDPTVGDVSPSEYWLENRGEGTTGFGVFSIVPKTRRVVLRDGRAEVGVWFSNHRQRESTFTRVDIETPTGLTAELSEESISLAPRESRLVNLVLRSEGAGLTLPSMVGLTAFGIGTRRVSAAVWVDPEGGAPREPSPGGAREFEAVAVEIPDSVVSAGGSLRAILTNRTGGSIAGTASWLTSFALWSELPDWRQTVVIPAGGRVEVVAPIHKPVDSFALLKFTYGGRIAYSESVAVCADSKAVVLSFGGIERLRLRKDRETRIEVSAKSLEGLTATSDLSLIVPEGWSSRVEGMRFRWRPGRVSQKLVRFAVLPSASAVRGELALLGPRGGELRCDATVAKIQAARSGFQGLIVDGDVGEWSPAEFTVAQGMLGEVRAAVRFSRSGLALAFDVKDDEFVQREDGALIWKGDSVQFALSLSPSSSLGYRRTDLEFGAGLTAQGGPLLWCWYAGEDGRTGRVEEAQLAIRREGSHIYYEMIVPRSRLPRVGLEPGSVLGFSYIANDDDGGGYRGATEWTPGMTGTKDSSLFGELLLIGD